MPPQKIISRKIIKIDPLKCNGCALCVSACHEGAIVMQNGKATLLRDDYCDGLGDCLPACPTNAISFEEREALPYNEAAVLANLDLQKLQSGLELRPQSRAQPGSSGPANLANSANPLITGQPFMPGQGCPGSQMRSLRPQTTMPANACAGAPGAPGTAGAPQAPGAGDGLMPAKPFKLQNELKQWPVQIKLVPATAPYLNNAHLLIAADCAAYAYANFHADFMQGKVTLIGCPKLDSGDYLDKILEILNHNHIQSLTVVRMSVPCCGGLERAAIMALEQSGKELDIPCQVVIISPDGAASAGATSVGAACRRG